MQRDRYIYIYIVGDGALMILYRKRALSLSACE